jgi:hypothetical protein
VTIDDPTLVAFAAHAALAALVSDALAASVAGDVNPEAADELLDMATTWATVRARGLAGDLLLAESPVPDDLADLDTGEGA